MGQTIVTIRMDEDLKHNFDYVCNELGMTMSTAITIFAKKVCREYRIPFEISMQKNNEREATMVENKTKFEVHIDPENSWEEIESYEGSFENLDDAYRFLVTMYDTMTEAMEDSENWDIRKDRPNFLVEFINPQNIYRHAILFSDEGLWYEYNNTKKNIVVDEDAGQNFWDVIYGFMIGLQQSGKI